MRSMSWPQALLRGEFVEEDTIVAHAPGGAAAVGLVLSHGGTSGVKRRAMDQGLMDSELLGSVELRSSVSMDEY